MDNEKIRAKFTCWLDTLAYRTKLNYIRDEQKYTMMDSIDEITEERLIVEETETRFNDETILGFDFDSEWLKDAFSVLTETEQKLLSLFFVEEKTLKEISVILNYTYRHIKRLYATSLKKLKDFKEERKNV